MLKIDLFSKDKVDRFTLWYCPMCKKYWEDDKVMYIGQTPPIVKCGCGSYAMRNVGIVPKGKLCIWGEKRK